MTTPLHNTPACPGHGSPTTHHPCLEARLTQLRLENEELRRTREHLRDLIRVLIEQRDQALAHCNQLQPIATTYDRSHI